MEAGIAAQLEKGNDVRFAVNVRGRTREWTFLFEGREEDWPTWISDGLDVERVLYSVPGWAFEAGLAPLWEFWYRLKSALQGP